MPPIRPENHKQKESPPAESQGARGNGNRRMSEDNTKEEQGLYFTFACFSIKSTVWQAVLVRAKIIPSC